MSVQISVIIACHNGAATLADQLEGLANQQWAGSWEVLFVDNRSTDDSRLIAEQYRERIPDLRLIDASEKKGKAFALNKAVPLARGRSVAFADADDQVAPGWLAAIGEAMETHELVACRWDIDVLNSEWTRKYRRNAQLNGVQKIDYPPYLPHAGGGTLAIRRDLHIRIGGFDEALAHLEDTDYVWRAQLEGAKLHFEPKAVMRIRFRDDLKGVYRQNRNYAEYNVLLSKRYRAYGKAKEDVWRRFFITWKVLARSAHSLFKEQGARAMWMARLGWQVGLLKGVVKYRVPPV